MSVYGAVQPHTLRTNLKVNYVPAARQNKIQFVRWLFWVTVLKKLCAEVFVFFHIRSFIHFSLSAFGRQFRLHEPKRNLHACVLQSSFHFLLYVFFFFFFFFFPVPSTRAWTVEKFPHQVLNNKTNAVRDRLQKCNCFPFCSVFGFLCFGERG